MDEQESRPPPRPGWVVWLAIVVAVLVVTAIAVTVLFTGQPAWSWAAPVMLGPTARRVLLIGHIWVSVGWMGAAAVYVALNVPALTGADGQTVRAAYLMMPIVAGYALVPLAVATGITGLALALGTKWGLLQHYWVTVSLAVTLFAVAVLVLHLPAVDELAAVAADPEGDVSALGGDLFHSVGGLVVLTVPLVLNVVRPRDSRGADGVCSTTAVGRPSRCRCR